MADQHEHLAAAESSLSAARNAIEHGSPEFAAAHAAIAQAHATTAMAAVTVLGYVDVRVAEMPTVYTESSR